MSDQDKRRRDEEEEPIVPVTGGDYLDDERSEQPDPNDRDPEDAYYDSLDVEGVALSAGKLDDLIEALIATTGDSPELKDNDLDAGDKVNRRDALRWELNVESAESELDGEEDEPDLAR